MKSLPALIFLLATALIQALGVYRYSNDAMTVSGQVFFPIFFVLATAYIGLKAPKTGQFSTAYYGIAGVGGILLVLTIIGIYTDMYWFYPTTTIYYIALLLLVILTALTIASVPKAEKDARVRPTRKTKKKAPQGTKLVAVAKSPAASDAGDNAAEGSVRSEANNV